MPHSSFFQNCLSNLIVLYLLEIKIRKNGFKVSETHLSDYGIKIDAHAETLVKIMKNSAKGL